MTTVTLRIYDLSMGMAAQMSEALLGKKIDYVPHTGVVVYGLEYFFGGGIQKMPPADVERTFGLRPVKTLDLGTTHVTQEVFHSFLAGIASRFTPETYDLFTNNCNNFSDEASTFLVGHGIPRDIIDLPQEFLATPMGQMLRPMLSQTTDSLNSQFQERGARMTFDGVAPVVTPSPAAPVPAEDSKPNGDMESPAPAASATFDAPAFLTSKTSSELMTVNIKSNHDAVVTPVQVPVDGTVGDLKAAIQHKLACPVDQQRLIFLGKILKVDADALGSTGLGAGKTVLFSRKGGEGGTPAVEAQKPAATPSPGAPATLASSLSSIRQHALSSGPDGKSAAITCLNTLVKISENIISNPTEAKYRSIKKSNALLLQRVGTVPGGMTAMLALGFTDAPDGNSFVLVPSARAWEVLTQGKEELSRLKTELLAPSQPPAGFAGGNIFGGNTGGMPDMSSVMQMAMQNPAMMQQAMQNPMVQQMIGSNPMMAAQMQQMMSNPAMMQQAMQMMQQNPAMMQQAQQMMGSLGGMGAGGVNPMAGMMGSGLGGFGAATPPPTNNGSNATASETEAEELARAIARSFREQ
jgi:hypothetical protein|eukprot:Stramenopile-MAST_4_protein_575